VTPARTAPDAAASTYTLPIAALCAGGTVPRCHLRHSRCWGRYDIVTVPTPPLVGIASAMAIPRRVAVDSCGAAADDQESDGEDGAAINGAHPGACSGDAGVADDEDEGRPGSNRWSAPTSSGGRPVSGRRRNGRSPTPCSVTSMGKASSSKKGSPVG